MSPDGTRINTVAVSTFSPVVTDATGIEWHLGEKDGTGWNVIYRGAAPTNGHGTDIWWLGGKIWIKGRNGNWWEALATPNTWRDTGSTNDPIGAPPPSAPTISNFIVTPASLPIGGGPVTASAIVTDVTTLLLDGAPVILPVTFNVLASHTFVLIASNASGSVQASASVAVAVVPPPPPLPPNSKYRNAQPYLFQTVRSAFEPSRIAGAPDYQNERTAVAVGPTAKFVDPFASWPWDRLGGDFLDKNLARNPAVPVPWFSALTNKATGNTTPYTYTVDCTEIEQYIQAQDRWNAIMLAPGIGTTRPIATTFTATPPSIAITYVDGTSAVLKCRLVAVDNTSSDYPNTTAASVPTPAFLEFERPEKAVQSAALTFTVTQHWSGGTLTVNGYVIDPPLNTDPVEQGVATSHPLDAGLETEPSIINVHRYMDGTTFNDFAMPPPTPADGFPSNGVGYNGGSEDWFDPAIFGNGPTDLGKLPNFGLGKWLNTNIPISPSHADGQSSHWDLVDSSYTNTDGYKPLAPGMGAMRIMQRGNHALVDGSLVMYGLGYDTTTAQIYLPEPLWGIQEMFVRHYFMLGAPRGFPYRVSMLDRLQVKKGATEVPVWTDCAGKFGISTAHDNTYGGFSGTSGGGEGWQNRFSWMDFSGDDDGPDCGGIGVGLHTFDFQYNNPPGFNFGATDSRKESGFGQRGGLGGMLYAGYWYCMEVQHKLNSINPADPGYVTVPPGKYNAGNSWGYVPNGEERIWIDGRKVLERTGMVFRTAPLYAPGYRSGTMRPVRDLGHRNVLLNIFHGGLTQNTVDRSYYISGVAYGTKYIGPMAGVTT